MVVLRIAYVVHLISSSLRIHTSTIASITITVDLHCDNFNLASIVMVIIFITSENLDEQNVLTIRRKIKIFISNKNLNLVLMIAV